MIIKKCDVCKNETDVLYDKMIATHTDTITGRNVIKQEKLHICRTCMGSINEYELSSQLEWYNDNVKEVEETSNENIEQNSGDAEGPTTGE
jgi:hypothetical protein